MRVAAVLMQRDEHDLLPVWLRYYAWICGGYENLFIFDDRSSDKSIVQLLQLAASKGTTVFWNEEGKWNLELKGDVISRLILDLREQFDWFLPVDCDEFICCLDHNEKPVVSKNLILEQLHEAASQGKSMLRVEMSFCNIPYTSSVYKQRLNKLAISSKIKHVKLQCGLHLYDWKKKEDITDFGEIAPSSLAHIHFHNRPFDDMQIRSRLKLQNRVSDFSAATLERYSGIGRHLTRYLLMREEEYLKSFKRFDPICIDSMFEHLNIDIPFSGDVDTESSEGA